MTMVENNEANNNAYTKTKGFALDITKLVSILLMLVVFAIVIVFSLIPVGFDWQKAFTDPDWWANFAVLAGLVLFGMVYGYSEGVTFLKNYIYGVFQAARNSFLDSVDKITKKGLRGVYAGWLQYYNAKKRKRIYKELMYRYQIKEEYFNVINIPQEEFDKIKQLLDEGKVGITLFEGVYYKLSLKQWDLVNSIRNGEIPVATIDNDCYFLTENHNALADDDKLVIKSVNQKNKNKIMIFTLRLVMLLAVSALIAGFYVDKFEGITEGAWFALVSRIMTLLSGVSTGVSAAKANNKIDVFVYRHKTDRNNEFMEDIEKGRYVPMSEQDLAKVEYEKQQAIINKEKEEAKEPHVYREPITPQGRSLEKDSPIPIEETPKEN